MLEHMTLDELLDELPPAERAALEQEAQMIAHPPAVDFASGTPAAAAKSAKNHTRSLSTNDISD